MRTIPLSTLQAMYALEADEFPIVLLTLTRGGDVIRLSSDATQRITDDPLVYGTVTNAGNFIFFPFKITLPADQEGAPPRMQITVDDPTGEIGWWLRSSTTKPVATVEIVSSADPDTAIATFSDFDLPSFKGQMMTIQAMLSLSNLESESYPSGAFTPTTFPGLF